MCPLSYSSITSSSIDLLKVPQSVPRAPQSAPNIIQKTNSYFSPFNLPCSDHLSKLQFLRFPFSSKLSTSTRLPAPLTPHLVTHRHDPPAGHSSPVLLATKPPQFPSASNIPVCISSPAIHKQTYLLTARLSIPQTYQLLGSFTSHHIHYITNSSVPQTYHLLCYLIYTIYSMPCHLTSNHIFSARLSTNIPGARLAHITAPIPCPAIHKQTYILRAQLIHTPPHTLHHQLFSPTNIPGARLIRITASIPRPALRTQT
jgi:hypothetical protein